MQCTTAVLSRTSVVPVIYMPLSLDDSSDHVSDDTSLAYASNSTDDIIKSMNTELENL